MLSSSNLFFVTDLMPMAETNTAGVHAIESNHLAKPAKDAKAASPTTKPKASHHAGFAYLARVGSDLDALVLALANDSRVRILQRPRIQTSDGEPATIFVGESRPYPTSSYYSASASGPSSVQQLQVGITLEVTPYVKPDGSVEMGIHQRLDQLAGTVTIANVGDVPITTSSEAQASLAVRDRETLLLGGWIQALKDQTHSGVPLLKDIPLLGPLFRTSSARTPRHELIVLIRPTVLPSQEATALSAKATHNWWGLRLFLCKLGSRRQLDFQLRDPELLVLADLNLRPGKAHLCLAHRFSAPPKHRCCGGRSRRADPQQDRKPRL